MPVDPNSVFDENEVPKDMTPDQALAFVQANLRHARAILTITADAAAPYRELSRDLYDSLMATLKALWFDAPFGPTENREASEVAIRARKMLGIPTEVHQEDKAHGL